MFPAFSKVVTLDNLFILLKGALLSLGLAAGSLLIGLAIAILIALLRFSTKKICHIIANIYVEFFRGTPMLVQIMYLFTVVPIVISMIVGHRVRINPVIVGLIALSLNSGAYQAEYIRGGINGVDKGQKEACETLGLSRTDMMRFVILPQAFRLAIPSMVGEFVTLIKDSSLLMTIGALKLFGQANKIGNIYYDYMTPETISIFYYLIMTLTISYFARKLEKRLARSV